MKKIALIGSTGSVGCQVLDAVRRHKDSFSVVALAANEFSEKFKSQVAEFAPEYFAAASVNPKAALETAGCEEADIVFNAAGGFAGLEYSLRAIEAGKPLALANKETLVCGGRLVTRAVKERGAEIIPVDSEHSAIWQCLGFNCNTPFERLIITASGGAFRGFSRERLENVTPEQALNHPTWKMGKKITVDSATLMNKGYEVIEAHELYNAPYSKIETVIQPASIVHSMVEFCDGAVMAQLGSPDMAVPIQLALSYPERKPAPIKKLDFKTAFSIDFAPIEKGAYPLFDLALMCGEAGGTLPCALNAADEVAVFALLAGKIPFTAIYSVVSRVLDSVGREEIESFEQLIEVDRAARETANKIICSLK